MATKSIVDGDGHVVEDAAAISEFLPSPYREQGPYKRENLVPPLDRFHFHKGQELEGSFAQVGPDGWLEFMDEVGIEAAVLYTTGYLAFGNNPYVDWAIATAKAYNDWLHEVYVKRSPRFKGMAMLPLQDPQAAAEELRRAVTELSMPGGMLPSNGMRAPLGVKEYWPIYEEANRLGCAIAIHGGAHHGYGMDQMNVYPPVHAIGHPLGQMINFGAIIFNGLLDRFPNVRWGFLEGGVAWLLLCLERFDRSYETHIPYDPRGELLKLPDGERVSDYIRRQIKEGRIYIGCEGEEPALRYVIEQVGNEPFIFSSDFPHEVNVEMCKREIEEIREELPEQDAEAILARNSRRFYRLEVSAPVHA
jgi:predicted TIM-barrel fold metal-dependent hydrolase